MPRPCVWREAHGRPSVGFGVGAIAALSFAAALAGAARAADLSIPLTVREPAGVARTHAPVTVGLPLPVGEIAPDATFVLRDGDKDVPLQVTPTVLREGKLRWVLLDFPLDVDANAEKRLELRVGRSSAKPAAAIALKEDDQRVEISTGPLSVRISKTAPFKLVESVQVAGKPAATGAAVYYVDGKTLKRHDAAQPSRVSLEYRGPQRVTVRIDGPYADSPLTYTTRITAWAGRSDLRIQHALANSNREQVYHACIRSAVVALRPAGDAAGAKLDEKAGALVLPSGRRGIVLVDRDFTGDAPRKLLVEDGCLAAHYVTPRPVGKAFRSENAWLYDLSHKTAELLIDFDAASPAAPAAACRSRLVAVAPSDLPGRQAGWYSRCEATAVGHFGSQADELTTYRQWGWAFEDKQVPRAIHDPRAYVRWEDNHYESEADSVEALLLMFLRTGQRGFFDQAEAWARYHMDLQAWRSDGWAYDDGAIWFPQGGPLGTRPVRKPTNIKYQHWGKGSDDDKELWHLVQAKSCYCHFYGTGLVDYWLLTGEVDALEAAVDLAETKNSEYRKHRKLEPGKSTISDTRGFGRGFYLIARLVEVLPDNAMVRDLARLMRDTLLANPELDDRGFVPSRVGQALKGNDVPPEMRAFMDKQGIRQDGGRLVDKAGNRWPIVSLGGTWQHAYVHNAADLYARLTGDEDLRDFVVAFGRFSAKFMLSDKCGQTHYYAHMDIPVRGQAWDPWKFLPDHVATTDGVGCKHSGWYTRFFPDAMARAYSLTRDGRLLERSKVFWDRGSKRAYQTLKPMCGPDHAGMFANHRPPKDDCVLSTARMFYEFAHPPAEGEAPSAVTDLTVRLDSSGRAEVSFTAPPRAARYQLKCAGMPIVADDDYDMVRDQGKRTPFWRAANCAGEPKPAAAGKKERFTVTLPAGAKGPLHFALIAYDADSRAGKMSNVALVVPP